MQVENTCHSLGRAGFQTPQLTVFGKMGKIGCQSALYVGESFRLEGTANVINVDKPAAVCDRKVIGVLVEQCNVGARTEPWSKPFACLRQ